MTDDQGLRDQEQSIDIQENRDLSYWSEELNLRTEDLKEIIKKVGPSVHNVRVHLAKNLLINWPMAY